MMRTIEAETIKEVALITQDESAPVARSGNYEAVRFNATKHGILSKLTVLAHEDHAEFDDLLAALIDEHRPTAMTEQHLVEELASIIWRKRRVLLAEGASINQGLRQSVSNPSPVVSAATPLQYGAASSELDLRELLAPGPEENETIHRDAMSDLESVLAAKRVLISNRKRAYPRALALLTPNARTTWEADVDDERLEETPESLLEYIRNYLEPTLFRIEREARFQPSIKAQVFGEGLRAKSLENLARYETHLDRKFERTLAMLLKLKEMRRL